MCNFNSWSGRKPDYKWTNTDNKLQHFWPQEKNGIISINMNNGDIMDILLSMIALLYIN